MSNAVAYHDDYKRPGPSIAEFAAAHPGLTFTHEYADELGTVAGRERFPRGK